MANTRTTHRKERRRENSKKKHRQVQRATGVGIKNVNVRENERNERNIDKKSRVLRVFGRTAENKGNELMACGSGFAENNKKKAKLMSPPDDGKNVVFWLLELVAQCAGGTCCWQYQ